MLEHFSLKLISPSKLVLSCKVESVKIPAKMGYMGVGARHAGLTCELKTGLVVVQKSKDKGNLDSTLSFFVSGGFFQVVNNQAILLAEILETKEDVDKKRVLESEQRAQARLKNLTAKSVSIDHTRALRSLERAQARKSLLNS